jgi:hypothetical protein
VNYQPEVAVVSTEYILIHYQMGSKFTVKWTRMAETGRYVLINLFPQIGYSCTRARQIEPPTAHKTKDLVNSYALER